MKNEILKEAVAFANAYGGALLLGIGESRSETACRRHVIYANPALCGTGGALEVGVQGSCRPAAYPT